jgi:hypothetical protein
MAVRPSKNSISETKKTSRRPSPFGVPLFAFRANKGGARDRESKPHDATLAGTAADNNHIYKVMMSHYD